MRFIQRTSEAAYVEVINGNGCTSYLGRRGSKQSLSLSKAGCVSKGSVMHEFIHALGFSHMHNHVDRDKFIKIFIENVAAESRSNFAKVNVFGYGDFATPYDLLSVMHYPRKAFSSNGRDTIVPIDSSYYNRIGSSQLSDGDAMRIRNMYQCTN